MEIDQDIRFWTSRQTGSQGAKQQTTQANLLRRKTMQSVSQNLAFWPKNSSDPVTEVAVTKAPVTKVAVTRVPLAKLQLQTSFFEDSKK